MPGYNSTWTKNTQLEFDEGPTPEATLRSIMEKAVTKFKGMTPEEINGGLCGTYAKYRDRFYDSEALDGVSVPLHLPFYQRMLRLGGYTRGLRPGD